MRFFERDLRVKLTIILLLFIVVAVSSALIVSRVVVGRIITDTVEQSAGDLARLAGNVVEVGLERRSTRAELLVSLPSMRDPATTPADRLATLSLFLSSWPLGSESVFTDTDGNVVCGTGKLSTIANATGTSWFENAQAGGVAFTYIYENSELTSAFFDAPALAVSAPERDINNQIFGYVVLFTNMNDIRRAVNNIHIEKTGHGFLVNEAGVTVAGRLFPPLAKPTAADTQSRNALIERMTLEPTGGDSASYGGRTYLVSWTQVKQPGTATSPGLDWVVGVSVPAVEAYAPLDDVSMAFILLAFILVVLGLIAAILFGRSITQPLIELVSTAERIGSGDLTADVAIRTRDQIGTLAAAFLRMRDYLRGALSEAGFTADKMSSLADEQSAGTADVFSDTEEIVDSVIVLAKNMEVQALKIRKLMDYADRMPETDATRQAKAEIKNLLQEGEILAEVGANKAVEIAAAAQDQRAAARDVAAAARRLSDMARELKDMVQRFKV